MRPVAPLVLVNRRILTTAATTEPVPTEPVPNEIGKATPTRMAFLRELVAKVADGGTYAAEKWQALLSFFRKLYGSLPEGLRNRLHRRSSANPGGEGAGTETLKASANSDSAKPDTGNGVVAADEDRATVEAEPALTAEEASKKKNAVEKLHVGLNADAKDLRFEMTPFAVSGPGAVNTMKKTLEKIFKDASGIGKVKTDAKIEFPKAMCFFKKKTGETESAHGVILLAKSASDVKTAQLLQFGSGFPKFGNFGATKELQVGEPITDPTKIDQFFFGLQWDTFEKWLQAAQADASKDRVRSTVKFMDDTVEIDNAGDWQQCIANGGTRI
mmetsp:Transcript_17674/g.44154  ORF Transcript_17674/g.44154 Transcript_17674/m.44154 type:complete len:329 (-) Transcript_17674:824-1810(-)